MRTDDEVRLLIRELRDRANYERKAGDGNRTFRTSHYATANLFDAAADELTARIDPEKEQ